MAGFARKHAEILTAVVGIDNAIVVATGDAVLVAARGKAENVKAQYMVTRPRGGARPASSPCLLPSR